MRWRSKAGDEPPKARRRKTAALKRGNGPKAHRRSSSSVSLGAKVTRLTRELKEARDRQRATAEVLSAISRSKFELQSICRALWTPHRSFVARTYL